jgi:hypothetical protein
MDTTPYFLGINMLPYFMLFFIALVSYREDKKRGARSATTNLSAGFFLGLIVSEVLNWVLYTYFPIG